MSSSASSSVRLSSFSAASNARSQLSMPYKCRINVTASHFFALFPPHLVVFKPAAGLEGVLVHAPVDEVLPAGDRASAGVARVRVVQAAAPVDVQNGLEAAAGAVEEVQRDRSVASRRRGRKRGRLRSGEIAFLSTVKAAGLFSPFGEKSNISFRRIFFACPSC